MKVALYYPWIYLTSGAERIILELSGRSRHEWTLYTSHYEPDRTFPELKLRDVKQMGSVTVKRTVFATGINCLKIVKQRLPMEQHDVLVVVCEGLGDLIVFRNSSRPVLCICLTPLRLVFDLLYRARYLDGRGWLSRASVVIGAVIFRWIDRMAWRRFERIFCISEEAKNRALTGGLTLPDRVEVIHPGLGFQPERPSERFNEFFLIPGRIMWTKNIELGILAFHRFRASHPAFARFRLIIAGIVDEKSKVYLAKLRRLAAPIPGIEFRIFPTDAELAELYETCYATLFTAFNEDWGIVPIEAMAFGKPVIAVNSGGPRESIADGVQGFMERPDPEAFANRMAELARDPTLAIRMGRSGHERARMFSWQGFTERIDDEIDMLCPSFEVFDSLGQESGTRPGSFESRLSTER